MVKFNRTKIFIFLFLIIIIGGFFILNHLNLTSSPIKSEKNTEKTGKTATLVIDFGESAPLIIKADFKEEIMVFDLLKEKTEEIDLTLKFKTYDVGVFIEAIGDKENGEDGKYWLYYVNGEMPQVAADKHLLSPGDKVEFKFETP